MRFIFATVSLMMLTLATVGPALAEEPTFRVLGYTLAIYVQPDEDNGPSHVGGAVWVNSSAHPIEVGADPHCDVGEFGSRDGVHCSYFLGQERSSVNLRAGDVNASIDRVSFTCGTFTDPNVHGTACFAGYAYPNGQPRTGAGTTQGINQNDGQRACATVGLLVDGQPVPVAPCVRPSTSAEGSRTCAQAEVFNGLTFGTHPGDEFSYGTTTGCVDPEDTQGTAACVEETDVFASATGPTSACAGPSSASSPALCQGAGADATGDAGVVSVFLCGADVDANDPAVTACYEQVVGVETTDTCAGSTYSAPCVGYAVTADHEPEDALDQQQGHAEASCSALFPLLFP